MENEFVNASFTLDTERIKRLRQMATETDRSLSAMVRVCIDQEWNRTHGTGPLPSLSPSEEQAR